MTKRNIIGGINFKPGLTDQSRHPRIEKLGISKLAISINMHSILYEC